MQRLRFINRRDEEIAFDSAAPYILWKVEGLGLPPVAAATTQASGQNGYTLHSILLDERTIRLSCHVHGESLASSARDPQSPAIRQMYELRKKINAVCNPLLGAGTLIYENDAGAWRATAFCKANPYAAKVRNTQTLDLTFECPLPFWLSKDPIQVRLAYVEGGLKFPFKTPGFFGTLGYQVHIDNDGDVPAPLEFFIDGGAINPVITNETTGEFIKLAKHLEAYDKLYINTDPEYMEVSLVSVNAETNEPERHNAYGYLTPDSTLFKLAQGMNTLKFVSDDENKKVRIVIMFNKRIVGV